eukprot:CAMPEP_0115569792 /NCGR_PEP_ID=MMETSP0271-20121206/105371_1 /TAXON_ID=71861 /ORGANISM="Scrippsiella trochoidea, Strain CCMP3099" /LENGTH=109 /DNA_ID=CAMNT_0003004319 /DNA_START=42 /DNA_END=372 /DNA_ORIENTATION=+
MKQLSAAPQGSREHQLDRGFHTLSNGDHDVRAKDGLAPKDPEHIVEEEANEHDCARLVTGQADHLDADKTERDAKYIVDDPILGHHEAIAMAAPMHIPSNSTKFISWSK